MKKKEMIKKPAVFNSAVTVSVASFNSDVEVNRLNKTFDKQVLPDDLEDLVKEFNKKFKSKLPDVRIYQVTFLKLIEPSKMVPAPKPEKAKPTIAIDPKKKVN